MKKLLCAITACALPLATLPAPASPPATAQAVAATPPCSVEYPNTNDYCFTIDVPANATPGVPFAITLRAYTDDGPSSRAFFVHFRSSDPTATLPPETPFMAAGTFQVTLNDLSQPRTITALDDSNDRFVVSAPISLAIAGQTAPAPATSTAMLGVLALALTGVAYAARWRRRRTLR